MFGEVFLLYPLQWWSRPPESGSTIIRGGVKFARRLAGLLCYFTID